MDPNLSLAGFYLYTEMEGDLSFLFTLTSQEVLRQLKGGRKA